MSITIAKLTIDCREYDMPMVLVQLKEAISRIAAGEVVKAITAEHPLLVTVFEEWAHETQDIYVHHAAEQGGYAHYMQKAKCHREIPLYPKTISNTEIHAMLLNGNSVHLIDVREEIEYMLGHIPEAVSAPLSCLSEYVATWNKQEPYYIICRTGNRSSFACKYLESIGFADVYNVLPGMIEWSGPIAD